MVARDIYFHLRATHPTPAATLQAMLKTLTEERDRLPRSAPPADPAVLVQLCQDDAWEQQWRLRQTRLALAHPGLQSDQKLAETMALEQALREILDNEILRCQPHDGVLPTKDDVARLKTMLAAYREARADRDQAEQDARRRELEQTQTKTYHARVQRHAATLYEHYDGAGPQYEILCQQVAEVQVRLENLTASGRDVSPDELARLYDLRLKTVAQLQKHTESTKSEAIGREASEIMTAIVDIFEREFAQEMPHKFQRAVNEIIARTSDFRQRAAAEAS